ncbi:MAG: CDP-archaeol synthase [Chloroflexi bacterium]|nr:CDP-archaeol synthase [Chloroflexota bacterium]
MGPVASAAASAGSAAADRSGALKRRLASAAVGLPVLAAAVLLGWQAAAAAAACAALAAGWEAAGLARIAGVPRVTLAAAPATVVLAGLAFAGLLPSSFGLAALAAAMLAVVALPRRRAGARIRYLAVGAALYFGAMLAFAAPLSALLPDGRLWLAFALLVTFAVDSAAYFTGRSIGRRRLAPSISPGKTWEGTAGGIVAGAAAGAVLPVILVALAAGGEFALRPAAGAALGVVMAAAAVLGDLSESWLKRRAGVKDAGGLIPGHGGFLDRLDSLAPNLAIVYYAASWVSG